MDQASVLITTEGTYPYYRGGVSVWCDQLIRHLPDVRFSLFSVVHCPSQQRQFPLLPNIVSEQVLPLWGTEEPGKWSGPYSRHYRKRVRTTGRVIGERFLPSFEMVCSAVLRPHGGPEQLAAGLYGISQFSQHCDYAKAMGSVQAWEMFLQLCASLQPHQERLDLREATLCLHWLQRYLALCVVPYPEVDVVHASMAGLAGIPGVLSKMKRGTAFLLSEHGLHLRELYMSLERTNYSMRARQFLVRFNDAVVRMNYHFADEVTSLGDFNRRWQLRMGADPRKVRVVANGVDPAVFHPRPAAPRRRPVILTMARIFPLKGIDVLLRAAAIVRDCVPEIEFRIMGEVADAKYNEHCLSLVEQHRLQPNVTFGVTSDPVSAYKDADVFCLPSISEGMPYAILEAMMSGCPVVATSIGNIPELLDGTGLLVRPNDAAALAQALLQLVEGPHAAPLRASLAEAALERARTHYSLQQITDQFREIYHGLVDATSTTCLSQSAF